jgi:hypothetical protein
MALDPRLFSDYNRRHVEIWVFRWRSRQASHGRCHRRRRADRGDGQPRRPLGFQRRGVGRRTRSDHAGLTRRALTRERRREPPFIALPEADHRHGAVTRSPRWCGACAELRSRPVTSHARRATGGAMRSESALRTGCSTGRRRCRGNQGLSDLGAGALHGVRGAPVRTARTAACGGCKRHWPRPHIPAPVTQRRNPAGEVRRRSIYAPYIY